MLQFLRERWTHLLLWAFVMAVAFMAGRGCSPKPSVEVREVVKWRERVEYRDRVETKTVAGPVRIRTVTKYMESQVDIGRPDRPVRVVEVVEERGPVVTVSAGARDALVIRDGSREAAARVISGPRYRVGAMAGARLVPLAFPPQLLVGARGEARIGDWPLWGGVWAMTDPLAPATHVSLGVSATMEW